MPSNSFAAALITATVLALPLFAKDTKVPASKLSQDVVSNSELFFETDSEDAMMSRHGEDSIMVANLGEEDVEPTLRKVYRNGDTVLVIVDR